jgi:serine/threonine protein kinase
MELCQGGDLLHYVRRRKQLEEPVAKYIMFELLKGVGYIHSRRIVHRDIKLENILLDNCGKIKLCDFGISKFCPDETEVMKEACGTPVYMAPEVIMCDKKLMVEEKKLKNDEEVTGYGFEVDIWSCGVVLYALLYGNFPFKGVSVRDIKLEVLTGNLMLKKNISESA